MEQSLLKLRRALEKGYDIQRKRNAYKTPPIPKAKDPEYKSFSHSMGENYRQNHRPQDFTNWASELDTTFTGLHLNFGRFRHITEANTDSYSDSHAKAFKRQLDELDKIVNDAKYFETYHMLPAHPVINFEGQELSQGYYSHKFNQSNKYVIPLLSLLWKSRQIETEDGRILRAGQPIKLASIYKDLGLNHDNFDLTVRAIHAAAHRKSINLKIRYPKQEVALVATQDSM